MLIIYTGKNDPLSLIKYETDKKIVRHLRKNGIDGFKIRDILFDNFGLPIFYNYPISYSKENRAHDKKIEYAKRYISNLVKSSLLTDKEISFLLKIESRLKAELISGRLVKIKNGKAVINFARSRGAMAKKIAISEKQSLGMQMAVLFCYIKKHDQNQHDDNEIYGLIQALYKSTRSREYEIYQIKKYIDNNKKYIKIISSKKPAKSKF